MHPVPIDCCQKLNASMPRILICKVKLSLKLNVPFLSFANRYYKQCFTLILFLWFECQWQHSESPPSCTSVRGTEGREEDANKASISRVGRPEGDSLLHPSSYCTRGNQGTSAQYQYSHRQEYFTTAAIVISRITVSYLHDLPAGIEYRVRNTQL